MKSIRRAVAAALATGVLPTTARANTADVQGWSSVAVSGKITANVLGSGELVSRLTDDAQRLGQVEARVQVGHAVSKNITIWLSYVHVASYAHTGPDLIEDQFMQQLNWNIGRCLGGSLSARSRLEQRFQRGVTGVAWRFRQQVKLAVPLGQRGVSGVVWVEPFVSVNRTSAVRSGLDQVRSFAGLGVKLSKHAELEGGYLTQYLDRANVDVSTHALSLSLSYRFD